MMEALGHPQPQARLSPGVAAQGVEVALLTGGGDVPYAYGLIQALLASGVRLDVIAGDGLDDPRLQYRPGLRLLNLRGDQHPRA